MSVYPSAWKKSTFTPLHKSKDLSDPNHYRGIAVSFCLGKLYNRLLNTRHENKSIQEHLISDCQGSSKKGLRAADHLFIIHFLIDTFVLGKNDLPPFLKSVNPMTLFQGTFFYTLLKE